MQKSAAGQVQGQDLCCLWEVVQCTVHAAPANAAMHYAVRALAKLADLEDDMRDHEVGAYGGPGPARPGRHIPRLCNPSCRPHGPSALPGQRSAWLPLRVPHALHALRVYYKQHRAASGPSCGGRSRTGVQSCMRMCTLLTCTSRCSAVPAVPSLSTIASPFLAAPMLSSVALHEQVMVRGGCAAHHTR